MPQITIEFIENWKIKIMFKNLITLNGKNPIIFKRTIMLNIKTVIVHFKVQ